MIVVPAASFVPIGQRSVEPLEAVIIDRQPLFLAALASILEAPPISAHVVTLSKSDLGLEIARRRETSLVICEVDAEPLSGLELAKALAVEGIEVPIVLLGEEGDEPDLTAALAGDVAGAFMKSSNLEEFVVGVQTVVAGHRAIGSALLARLLERPISAEAKRLPSQLSPTEAAILTMIGQAHSIPTIAASRGISNKTVRNHLAKIYRKLELHGRTEAMLWAARMGLTES